jgi:predicted aspartyl protease
VTGGARRGADGERGSVTAEFAAVLPVVVAVATIVVAAVLAAGATVRLQVAAAAVARALGRDDLSEADRAAVALAPGAAVSVHRGDGTVCVRVSRSVRIGTLPSVQLAGSGCALDGGR